MTLIRTPVDCDNNFDWATTWLIPLLDAMVEYINSLESTQQSATDAVALEVGAARDGAATLLAKIKTMDGVSDDLKAQIESLVLGKKADIYDPSASYVKNDFVIYDTSIYVCLSEASISGVAPSDKSKWKLLLGYERAPMPTLAGPLTANEGTTHDISLGASYDANAKYYPTVSGGSLSGLMQFTEGDYAGQWGWKWTMPIVDTDTVFTIEVYSTADGYARSYLANRSVNVKDVPVNGVAVAIADSEWNKTPDTDGIEPPAYSNPADNANQVLSAELEIELASGELENVINASTTGFDTSSAVEVGDEIEADTGSSSVDSVSGGGTTTVETSQAGASNSFGSTFMNNNYPLPNGERIDALGLKSSSAQTGYLFIYRQDSATEYTCVARVELTHSGSGLLEYAELDTPYDVPSTGGFYVAGANFNTAGAYMYDTSALRANPVDAVVGETLTFAATTVAPVTGYQYGSMYAVTVNPPFSVAPTKVFKKPAGLALKLGAGVVGEYMGPEIPLAWGTGSNTSDLVFESSESLAEKVVKPNGPPVGGTGAELIPSFVGAIYDEETQTSTVDGWSMSQNAVINQNYPFCKTRQNDEATTVPGYLPSWATGSASGYGFVTAPQPVVIGALILGGGIPGGLSASPPENILLEGFNGTSWDVLVDTTETRWTSDWQEFEYPVSNAAAYTEFRLAMDRDKVLHKIQFKEASDLTYVADPSAVHNDLEINGLLHKVAQVVEKMAPGASAVEGTFAETQTNSRQMGYISGVGNRACGLMYNALNELITGVVVNNTQSSTAICVAKVYSTDENNVATTLLRTSDQQTMIQGDIPFSFDSPVKVDSGKNYWITIEYLSGDDDWACGVCAYDFAGPYGSSYFDGPSEDASTMQAADGQAAWGNEMWRMKINCVSPDFYTTTVTLATPLAQAPTGAEVVKIPDRCNLPPAALTAQVVSGRLKITSDMITLNEDPNLKRLVMAVFGPVDMRFKSATMNIQERS